MVGVMGIGLGGVGEEGENGVEEDGGGEESEEETY
jgi:hypothetical protein